MSSGTLLPLFWRNLLTSSSGLKGVSSTLKMEAANSLKCEEWHHAPEYGNLHNHSSENLRFRIWLQSFCDVFWVLYSCAFLWNECLLSSTFLVSRFILKSYIFHVPSSLMLCYIDSCFLPDIAVFFTKLWLCVYSASFTALSWSKLQFDWNTVLCTDLIAVFPKCTNKHMHAPKRTWQKHGIWSGVFLLGFFN
jgi:hypothetical protein